MTRYRRRYRYRRRSRPEHAIGVILGVILIAGLSTKAGAATHRPAAAHAVTVVTRQDPAAAAIAYARAQLGKPYLWGGAGPAAFDCSGLVMRAWARAGVQLPRTSQQQWAAGRHVPVPDPGDLVFFAGADGTMTAPGHVGLVIGGGRMIEAYGTGYPIRISSWRRADLVGFTDPRAR